MKAFKAAHFPDVPQYEDYRLFLEHWFTVAKHDPQIKMTYRKFSELAGFKSPNFLKRIIDGDKNLSFKSAKQVATAIGLSPAETDVFLTMVMFNQASEKEEKDYYYKQLLNLNAFKKANVIKKHQYDYYNNWYYVVIREMVGLPEFCEDPEWIAQRLESKVTVKEVKSAIDTLLRVGLVDRDKNGRLRQKDGFIGTEDTVKKGLVTKFHKEMLDQASQKLDRLPVSERHASSVTALASKEAYKEIEREYSKLREKILKICESDSGSKEVYQFNLQAFPMTKSDDSKQNDKDSGTQKKESSKGSVLKLVKGLSVFAILILAQFLIGCSFGAFSGTNTGNGFLPGEPPPSSDSNQTDPASGKLTPLEFVSGQEGSGLMGISTLAPVGDEVSGSLEFNVRIFLKQSTNRVYRFNIHNDEGQLILERMLDFSCASDQSCAIEFPVSLDTTLLNDGWRQLRFRAMARTIEGNRLTVSNGVPIKVKNGNLETNSLRFCATEIFGRTFVESDSANTVLECAPTEPISGEHIFNVKSQNETDTIQVVLDEGLGVPQTDSWISEREQQGQTLYSGAADWRTFTPVHLDTRTLSNGWHKLTIYGEGTISNNGQDTAVSVRNSIWFYVKN